jgi:hypothetical protein
MPEFFLVHVNAQVAAPGMHNEVEVSIRFFEGKEMVATAQAFVGHAMNLSLKSAVMPGFVERTQHFLPGNSQIGHSAAHVFPSNQGIENRRGPKGNAYRNGPLGAIMDIGKYGNLPDVFLFLECEKGL